MPKPGLIFHVEAAVQRYHFPYSVDIDAQAIDFRLVAAHVGEFEAQFVISPKQGIVRLFVLLEDPAALPEIGAVNVETAIRVSRQLAVGSLEMDIEEGVVWFRHACDMEHVANPTNMAEAMMKQSVFALNLYRTTRTFVAGGAPPAQAVDAALLVLDAA